MLTTWIRHNLNSWLKSMPEREIRFAKQGEEDVIIDFLREHWHAEFSVVKSRTLFDFLYSGKSGPNFVLAYDGQTLVGILGLSFYDEMRTDVFLTLWRSIDTRVTTGIDMLKFVLEQNYDSISSVGTREEVLIIYKLLKFNTGSMDQWVKFNGDLGSYQILKHGDLPPKRPLHDRGAETIHEVSGFDPRLQYFSEPPAGSPFKSHAYLTKRYLQHPNYSYRVFEYSKDGEVLNYFVTRTVEYNGATALRLVDCVANDIGFVPFSAYVDSLFASEGHEYIDMYCLNLKSDTLTQAGFYDCAIVEDLVVPNFFEPFVQEAEVKHFITTLDAPCLYKGDGDADRPFRLV
mgnify:CR=1 FL=1